MYPNYMGELRSPLPRTTGVSKGSGEGPTTHYPPIHTKQSRGSHEDKNNIYDSICRAIICILLMGIILWFLDTRQ
jgi:hypothetical protein